jgi:serine/threonine protein kinase
MGFVYKAEDTSFNNRLVAIKEMRQTGLDPQEVVEAAEHFKQEAMLLASLKHPSLPSIYDYFSAAGRWYLVMDFIEGETLDDHLNAAPGKVLSVSEALNIGIQLCKVLGYLHTRPNPIIFRDLKPSNIMITSEGNVYLIDFGIARFFKPGQAKDTAAYGSAGYASLEQFGRAQTTPQSDIYSLGATLHQMLSGDDPSRCPFHFAPLPSSGQPAFAELAALITRMLDMDASKRPVSMAAVKQTLEWIADQLQHPPVPLIVPALPPETVPPTVEVLPPPPPPRWWKKRRTLITVVSLSILSVVVVLCILSLVILMSSPFSSKNNTQKSANDNNATNNVNATATADWATTSAANPDPYQPSGPLVLWAPLSQPGAWTVHSDTNWGGQCQFVNNMYQVHQLPSNKFYACHNDGPLYKNNPQARNLSNFEFEVTMMITQGDCGGLTIRDDNNGNHYVFEVCQDGSYAFVKYTDGNGSTVVNGNSSAINQGTGQTNVIAVVANGSNFDLYVNSQKIKSASNNTYSQGSIGLVAGSASNETTVTYQNARVWTI